MTELISIIIPLYNTEKYLKETIDSIIKQSYENWELIIVNDGSTDNSELIAQSYAQLDKRITLITKENTGVSDSRNIGFQKARGELIAFLDADDYWCPENLEVKYNKIIETNCDFVFCDSNLVNENSESIGESIGNDKNIHHDYLMWINSPIPAPCSNCLIRKSSLKDIKFDTDLSTAADQDFTFYLSKKNKGIRIEKKYLNYRVLPNSMSRNIASMESDHIKVYNKARKNNLFPTFWFKQKCYSNLYLILAGSWWKNGNNKFRALFFIVKSVINYPPNIVKLFQKSFK